MTLKINDDAGALDPELLQLTKRRFEFALSRFDSWIESVEITIPQLGLASFQSANPPQQHRCHVAVKLSRASDVSKAVEDGELSSCIVHAANITGRAVSRAIELAQNSRSGPRTSFAGGGPFKTSLTRKSIGGRVR